jgi:hypothetical protein
MGGYDTDGDDISSSDLDHGGYEEKCSICKKRFRSESAWERHSRKHASQAAKNIEYVFLTTRI